MDEYNDEFTNNGENCLNVYIIQKFGEMVEAVGLAERRLQEFYQLTGDADDPLFC